MKDRGAFSGEGELMQLKEPWPHSSRSPAALPLLASSPVMMRRHGVDNLGAKGGAAAELQSQTMTTQRVG